MKTAAPVSPVAAVFASWATGNTFPAIRREKLARREPPREARLPASQAVFALGAERHVQRPYPHVEGGLRQAQGPARQDEKRGHAPDRRADRRRPRFRGPLG